MAATKPIRVASIGECMIELRHRSERELELAFGGDTLNMAVYLARLTRGAGVRVDYVTALGADDPYSEQMVREWEREGVGTGLVERLPGRLPGLYLIRLDERGERSFTYYRSAAAARDMLRGERGREVLDALRGYDLVYLTGITLSILADDQRGRLVELAEDLRRRGGRLAFDSNFRPAGWPDPEEARRWFTAFMERADILLPTLDDDRRLLGDADPESCAERRRAMGASEVAVKLGPEGCHVASDAFTGRVPPEPVPRVVDTTAAGDSFNAGYLAARLLGRPPKEAARLGNRVAARVIAHPGAIVPLEATADLELKRSPG